MNKVFLFFFKTDLFEKRISALQSYNGYLDDAVFVFDNNHYNITIESKIPNNKIQPVIESIDNDLSINILHNRGIVYNNLNSYFYVDGIIGIYLIKKSIIF